MLNIDFLKSFNLKGGNSPNSGIGCVNRIPPIWIERLKKFYN